MAENNTETESQHSEVVSKCSPICLTNRKVIYISNDDLLRLSDSLMRVPGRASMVHSLIEAYGLLKYMCIRSPVKASDTDILQFHSPEYVDTIRRLSEQIAHRPDNVNEEEESDLSYDETALQCGLGYDCPVQHGLFEVAKYVVGGTICAAESLIEKHGQVAINWTGGWHHAKRDEAAGFCYLNDIVLGILKLREHHDRVLYVDLDVHHGDGVQDAFSATAKVMTVSFHKYSTGFFPGTGSVNDIGFGRGKHYSINVPLKDGMRDPEFYAFFTRVLSRVREVYRPEAVVCQCGADGLTGDPMDSFNLTLLSLGRCVHYLLQWNLPLLLLGGGGYDHANTARCWTYITSIVLNRKLPNDIPEHKYFTDYGPDYELHLKTGNRPNQNTKEYLNKIYHAVLGHLKKVEELES